MLQCRIIVYNMRKPFKLLIFFLFLAGCDNFQQRSQAVLKFLVDEGILVDSAGATMLQMSHEMRENSYLLNVPTPSLLVAVNDDTRAVRILADGVVEPARKRTMEYLKEILSANFVHPVDWKAVSAWVIDEPLLTADVYVVKGHERQSLVFVEFK